MVFVNRADHEVLPLYVELRSRRLLHPAPRERKRAAGRVTSEASRVGGLCFFLAIAGVRSGERAPLPPFASRMGGGEPRGRCTRLMIIPRNTHGLRDALVLH